MGIRLVAGGAEMKRLLILVIIIMMGLSFTTIGGASGYKMTERDYKHQVMVQQEVIKELRLQIKQYKDNRSFVCDHVGVAFLTNK